MAPSVMEQSRIPADGKYAVASIALDLTGKKLIDEICQLAGYNHPDKSFAQHVMPHRNISRSATRTHGIKIFTNFGRFRVLKDTRSMKTLKTKSEYSTLMDFMEWLKQTKGESDGIILLYHDNNKQNVTSFLIEALERYKMADDFFKLVVGFVNCSHAFSTASAPPTDTVETEKTETGPVSLKAAYKKYVVKGKDSKDKETQQLDLDNAKHRAMAIYQLGQKIFQCENEVIPSYKVAKWGTVREQEMENLEKQRQLAEKVRSLRPIFISSIRKGPKQRTRAVALRKYLINEGTDFESLKSLYETGKKDKLTEFISKTEASKRPKDMEDLVDMIFEYFKNGAKDFNSNSLGKEMGQGEPSVLKTEASVSSTETDEEEFEEAKEGHELETTGSVPVKV